MEKEEASQTLRSYERNIMLHKVSSDGLCGIIHDLPLILADNPDLKQETFRVWEKVAEYRKNSRYSLEDTYSSLKDVILKDKNNVPQAVSVFTKALASDENDYEALCLAHETLSVVAQSNFSFAGKAAQAFNKALDRYEESITPKTPLKKFFQQLNDIGGEVDFKKRNIQIMREDVKKLLPKSNPIVATQNYGHEK
ncbi:MAG: hypothetical protein IJ778_05250 [Alphaproteobacteria bacterium]|nr:hypothetical protein [Alphaproteobacteria bacterium]